MHELHLEASGKAGRAGGRRDKEPRFRSAGCARPRRTGPPGPSLAEGVCPSGRIWRACSIGWEREADRPRWAVSLRQVRSGQTIGGAWPLRRSLRDRDKHATERLGRWAFVRSGLLSEQTIQSFGSMVLNAGAGLETRDSAEIVSSDLKTYESGGLRFAIAQAEVNNLVQLEDHYERLTQALIALREQKGLDFAMLMITDVVGGSSRLLLSNELAAFGDLPYELQPDGTRLAPGVVSRKKQLLPVVLGLLER